MNDVWHYSFQLNELSATIYLAIFVYGVIASVRDIYKLLSRWFGV